MEEQIPSLSNNISLLCGKEDSILEKYYLMLDIMESGISDQKPEILIPITENFHDHVGRYLQNYRNIFLKEFSNVSQNLNDFKKKSQKLQAGLKPQDDISDILGDSSDQPIRTGLDMDAMKKKWRILEAKY